MPRHRAAGEDIYMSMPHIACVAALCSISPRIDQKKKDKAPVFANRLMKPNLTACALTGTYVIIMLAWLSHRRTRPDHRGFRSTVDGFPWL